MEIIGVSVLVVCIMALLIRIITKSLDGLHSIGSSVSQTTKAENHDSYASKTDNVAWGGFVLFSLALIVRFIIGAFKLLVQVARGMGKD